MAPLPPDHEEHARELAQREVRRFARLLADEIAATPMRADGNMNARDLWRGFNDAITRYDEGQDA